MCTSIFVAVEIVTVAERVTVGHDPNEDGFTSRPMAARHRMKPRRPIGLVAPFRLTA
jgi:hypothetical protein